MLISAVCTLVLVSGCGGETQSHRPVPAPAVTAPAASPAERRPVEAPSGPFTDLLKASVEELQQRLGKPSEVKPTSEKTVSEWIYPSIGLEVAVFDNRGVFWITQTRGRITPDIQVGDPLDKVRAFGEPVESLTGDTVVRIDTAEYGLDIHFKDGKVVFAQILPPSR